jgi:hypothetical protein
MYIERPNGIDITDERVTLTLRDENGLRAGTVTIAAVHSVAMDRDTVRVSVERVPDDQSLRVEFVTVN